MTADLDRLAFIPTREAGLARLAAFAPRAGRWYANHGGVDHGPGRRANTAGLSPWLTCRLLTPEEAVAAVESEHGPAASTVFRDEVEAPLRRRAWLAARPDAWRQHRLRVESLFRSMAKSPTLLAAYDEAVEGRTGIDAFDAWARELAEVGWLHSVALRAFASLWIFSLRLPWELGADLHHRAALDGEAAGLPLWREVAGLERGVPHYAVQVDELTALSAGRFQPKRRLVEEQPKPLVPIRDAEVARRAGGVAAKPRNDATDASAPKFTTEARTGLLLTDGDLSLTASAGLSTVAVAALSTAPHRSPFGPAPVLSAWLDGALADASNRAPAAAERLDDADWTAALLSWAARRGFERIAMAPPSPGPAAERLAAAARRLSTAGVTLAWTKEEA